MYRCISVDLSDIGAIYQCLFLEMLKYVSVSISFFFGRPIPALQNIIKYHIEYSLWLKRENCQKCVFFGVSFSDLSDLLFS